MTSSVSDSDATTPRLTALGTTINHAIARLRHLSQQDIQSFWRWCSGDLPIKQAVVADTWQNWAIAPINDRNHIAWDKGKRVLWLGQQIHVPETLNGFPVEEMTLRLALTWWADNAQIFVNGVHVHTGDLFDCFCRILLAESVQPGQCINVALRLVSPGHDHGAIVQSRCLYETPNQQLVPVPEPSFVADEMTVLQHYLTAFAPHNLSDLNQALQHIDWQALSNRTAFNASLIQLRDHLTSFSDWIKQRTIHLLGHAHLDLAWLWPISETWDAAQRTFESVLMLQQDFPDLIFTHSTPALYAWLEEYRPDLLSAIQSQVKAGVWEIGAGLWVEPELNIVGGESIIRQVLYGQRYTHTTFGHISRIAWLPDSFGFCWQLPQILRQGGIDYFATQKLRWNDTNAFPHDLFEWRSPDGTTIHSLTLPPIGSDIDPAKMADYACQWETNTGLRESLWLPGVGDHGGGPTRDMLNVARRWQRSPFFPTLQFTTSQDFLDRLSPRLLYSSPSPSPLPTPPATLHEHSPTLPLPTWNDELYLELHRGCYTTHTEQKCWNRRCEALLYQAELFASIATLLTGTTYPQKAIEHTWKRVLFNQFHDILPGSSIPEVYDEVNPVWKNAEDSAEEMLNRALGAIACHIQLPPAPFSTPHSHSYPFVLFNSLSWERSELVTVQVPSDAEPGQTWAIFDHTGAPQVCQPIQSQMQDNRALAFRAKKVPGVGYQVFWLNQIPIMSGVHRTDMAQKIEWVLENEHLRVIVNPTSGDLDCMMDKTNQQEVLAEAGNQLQFFRDKGQYWDAWNIAPDYEAHPLPDATLVSIEWIEKGCLQQRLRIIKTFGQSYFQQDYVLQANSPMLQVETDVDWHEDYTLVKVIFPLAFEVTTATYEMPCGAIERSPTPTTSQEQAKWEVSALNWADVGNTAYGVSILSDYKHGVDATASHIRLTLLKSPKWPDAHADQGHHHFTYGIYPHAGHWTDAETVRMGYAFNQPLIVKPIHQQETNTNAYLSTIGQFLHIPNENLFLIAFKPAEESAGEWIMRLYEGHGEPAKCATEAFFSTPQWVGMHMRPKGMTNLLEKPLDESEKESNDQEGTNTDVRISYTEQNHDQNTAVTTIAPWKIVTFTFQAIASLIEHA